MNEKAPLAAPRGRTAPTRSIGEVRSADAEPNPYIEARRLRVNGYLDLARTLTNYRVLALAQLALLAVLSGALLWQARATRIKPYVVHLDRYGNAVAFGPAAELADPDRALLVHELSRWIWGVRSVTSDAEVQRRLVLQAYAYTTGRAVNLLNGWFRRNSPFERAESETVSVQVTSVLALSDSERTWQVQWLETAHDSGGHVTGETRWQALLTVVVDPPDAVEEVTTNPLGIRVASFDWTRLPDTGDSF